jgi:putative endonuclease
MASHSQELGEAGEFHACAIVQQRGMRILDRNWRIKSGEIDIVAAAGEVIVFIEVKTRRSTAFGHPLESISTEKAYRLQRLALAWLATHQKLGSEYRIDVIGIIVGRSGELTIDYREAIL